MSPTGRKELLALRDLINSSLDALLADEQLDIPSIHEPLPGPPIASAAAVEASGAAAQLQAMLEGSAWTMQKSMGGHVVSSLRVAIEAHVVETIREAGGSGLHVKEIAKSSNINPEKLARILRLLAGNHIFTETAYETFANNRCSIAVDTGKSVAELKGNRFPYADTNGFAALVAHTADDHLKANAFLAEAVLSPETADSYKPSEAPFAIANKVDMPFWEYIAQPGKEELLARFGYAMIGVNSLGGGLNDVLLSGGFDFNGLKEGATLVDVGGGAGAVSLLLAEKAAHLKIIVQDRPEVIKREAKSVWEKSNPSALASGQVQLTAHDFFAPQPVNGAEVYLMRYILHDWAKPLAIPVLQHLSDAASPNSKLVLIDHVIDPLCPSADSTAPYPLLPSKGVIFPLLVDLQMLGGLNALERTEQQFRELGDASGWRLERVAKPASGMGGCHLIFAKA
ncbi:S-adenosyl-L-methionine-dependent methyltransferase [Leucosporidium creatinivorum]|uniref:S-adenosyl-L-methionine-dependent methyltransferase n=1 Tax=Leucosporidium creatinivorum TaxID=106004 RepID=A0A1Y2E7D3_9BASI|nr:S-adenosyl-L-methionine-dependent methyltransferase [Leucosporidium creatinivorum]